MEIEYFDRVQHITPPDPHLDGKAAIIQSYTPSLGRLVENYILRGLLPENSEDMQLVLPVIADIIKQIQPSRLSIVYSQALHWILQKVVDGLNVDKVYLAFRSVFDYQAYLENIPRIVEVYLNQNMQSVADFIIENHFLAPCLKVWLHNHPRIKAKHIFTLTQDSLRSLDEENLRPIIYSTLVYLVAEHQLVLVNLPTYHLSPNYMEECARILRNSTSFSQYSRHMDAPINYGLRQKCIDTRSWDLVEDMLNHLDQSPEMGNAYFYRGSGSIHQVNLGFTSKTVNVKEALDFVEWESLNHDCCLTIYYYPGVSKHMYIKSVSKYPDEEEVLTYPGERFQEIETHKFMTNEFGILDLYIFEFQGYLEEDPEINHTMDVRLDFLFKNLYKEMPWINYDASVVVIQGTQVEIFGNILRKRISYAELKDLIHNRIYTEADLSIFLIEVRLERGIYQVRGDELSVHEYYGEKTFMGLLLNALYSAPGNTLWKDDHIIDIPQKVIYTQHNLPECLPVTE